MKFSTLPFILLHSFLLKFIADNFINKTPIGNHILISCLSAGVLLMSDIAYEALRRQLKTLDEGLLFQTEFIFASHR